MSHETQRATHDVATASVNFLDAAEVARRLNVSRSTVYNLISSGRLAAHCLGGGMIRPRGLRIPETAVTAFMAASVIDSQEVTS